MAISAQANSNIASNVTWYRNLYEPLVEMGHEVELLSTAEGEQAMIRKDHKLRSSFSNKLLEKYKRENQRKPFDLFFGYLKEGMIEPEVIKEIGSSGVPTCNFSCNNAHQFYLVESLAPFFDFNLYSEKNSAEKFHSVGANAVWWPMASNPKYFKPQNLPRTIDVSFVGVNYGVRAQYINFLLRNGIAAHAYGPGWQGNIRTRSRSTIKRGVYLLQTAFSFSFASRASASAKLASHDIRRLIWKYFPDNVHAPVSDAELISLYSKSKISLGFLGVYDNHDPSCGVIRHLHLREFEAPMCGAFYCTSYSDELAEMFVPDKEIITYNDEGELVDKVRYYLKHLDQAEKIREAGHRRALRDHTYHKRFEQLFERVGLH